ncbi:YafY family protein [Paenibacillus aurantius]|uniref:YafY family protein n=1 Tax=Paenibacillus aurantius TaxID=2918900 RepID=A0AA96REI8_9BACL|nr:YafY family protein [Paenibacillus aurantius]WNQ10932.1 YafY family protein [Paenibacillus aurantius]
MRADRLLNILLLLQNHGRLTSRELAARLEVSERTVFRDMEALSAAGVPVYAERGTNGGWMLAEGYRTQLTGMKKEELLSLLVASPAGLLADLDWRHPFESGFQKLLAAAPEAIRRDVDDVLERIHLDGAGWRQAKESLGSLAAVQEAVWGDRLLRLRYDRDGQEKERIVRPLGLVAKRSIWYLVAGTEEGMRTFRISRLLDAVVLEETFRRPEDFSLADYWESSVQAFQSSLPSCPARIRLKPECLPLLKQERYVRILRTEEAEPGWVTVHADLQTLDWGARVVLGFGPSAEALEPEELRERVRCAAEAAAALYR